MPSYVPMEIEPRFSALDLELARSLWTPAQSFVEYICAKTRSNLRIAFQKIEIMRIVDDLPLLDLEDEQTSGILQHHFGYVVSDAAFWRANERTIERSVNPMTHYRFITGNSCVDIISSASPHTRVLAVAN
ncbi:hypothetical protein J2046_006820 [Rhizobium petrolearium]|nr:hypothetical protein [Neorhizobium petrolearium]